MELKQKVVVVTGGSSGIGKALAQRFRAEGAKCVVVADIDMKGAQAVAAEIGGLALQANVAEEVEVQALIERTESEIGPIDLFCSNAGIGRGHGLQDTTNADWDASWRVNVMAHVHAARHLVPRMIARGGGYLLNTCSAAGLLNQIGGMSYGVTKHAAVAFAEWVSLTHRHEGIRVSVLCPQVVRTAMIADTNDPAVRAAAVDGMLEPEDVARCVVEGLAAERFLILPHPQVAEYLKGKALDYDRWLGGMNKFHRKLAALVQK